MVVQRNDAWAVSEDDFPRGSPVGTALVGILVLGEPRDSGRLIALSAIIGGIVGLKMVSPH